MRGLKSDRARVVFYVPCLEVGGVEKKVHDLAVNLPRDRFDPVVLWSCYWGPLGESLRDAGIPVHHVPLNRPAQLNEVASALRDLRPDIFHSFSYRKDACDVRAAFEAEVPTILTYRADMRFWDDAQQPRDWELLRNRETRRIVVCSEAVGEVVREVEKAPAAKIHLIYNGVNFPEEARGAAADRAELGIGADDFLIGYVGNYRPEKGHETLLQAFRSVLATHPSARLLCCGGGRADLKARLQSMAEELGIAHRVQLRDLERNPAGIHRALDLYVQPSDTEGFSNSLLEAMSHAKAIVATAAGGNREAIEDGETGLLVAPRDAEAMASAVLRLIRDPQLVACLGQAARARVAESFQFHHMLDGYVNLYEQELSTQ